MTYPRVHLPNAQSIRGEDVVAALGFTPTDPDTLQAQEFAAAPVDAVAAAGTITSNNTNVTEGDTVTIGNKTYTYMDALTPVEGEVLKGADADASLLNLIRAINHTGTPDTDYKCAAAHTQVTAAASVTSHAFAVTAIVKGTVGNAIATTADSVDDTLTWGAATLEDGIDGTPGSERDLAGFDGELFYCTADATVATSGAWKKVTLESL